MAAHGLACVAAADGSEDVEEGDPNLADDPNADPGDGDERGAQTVQAATSSGLIDAEEAAFLTEINNFRKANGKPALKISIALTHAAHAHSADMAA